MQSVHETYQPEEEFWRICPVCKQPNPAETLHCRHCWGASLHSVEPISSDELVEVTRRRQTHLKRLRLLKVISVSIGAPLMLVAVVLFGLYTFTDTLFAPPVTLNSGPLPGEWTMFRRDLDHSGSINLSDSSPQGVLKWTFSTGAPVHSSPTVVDGTVYIGSQDHKLYALDAETGNKLWEFQTGSHVDSSPAVVNGIVYFGSNDGKLYALDARNGRKLWHYQAPYPIKSSPAVADGIVYFGCDDYRIYALDAVTGTKLWDFETDSWVMSSPAVVNGILCVGSMDGSLYALNAQTGRFRLKCRLFFSIISSPAVSNDGIAYVNTGNGHLYAIDTNDRNWPAENDLRGWWMQFYAFHLAPPPPPKSGFMWGLRIGWKSPSHSSPLITNGTVYTGADNRLYSIDIESHAIHWVFSAGGTITSSPALGNNTLYIGSEDGRIYAVDATNGRKIWDFLTEGKVTSSPTLANGTLYVGSYDGKVYAIE